jgi:hypothetical protein
MVLYRGDSVILGIVNVSFSCSSLWLSLILSQSCEIRHNPYAHTLYSPEVLLHTYGVFNWTNMSHEYIGISLNSAYDLIYLRELRELLFASWSMAFVASNISPKAIHP